MRTIMILATAMLAIIIGSLAGDNRSVAGAMDCQAEQAPAVTSVPGVAYHGQLLSIRGQGFGTNANYRAAGRVLIGGEMAVEPGPVEQPGVHYYLVAWQNDHIGIIVTPEARPGVHRGFVLVDGRYAEFVIEIRELLR